MTINYQTPTATPADENGNEIPSSPPPEDQPAQAALLNVRFANAGGNELHFKMKPTTRMFKAMNAYSDRWGRNKNQLRFLFEGERVLDHHTPAELEIADHDTIEVHEEQIGGGDEV